MGSTALCKKPLYKYMYGVCEELRQIEGLVLILCNVHLRFYRLNGASTDSEVSCGSAILIYDRPGPMPLGTATGLAVARKDKPASADCSLSIRRISRLVRD